MRDEKKKIQIIEITDETVTFSRSCVANMASQVEQWRRTVQEILFRPLLSLSLLQDLVSPENTKTRNLRPQGTNIIIVIM